MKKDLKIGSKMIKTFNKILIVAPHCDDGELGCSGTMARFIEEGKEVYYVAFSSAEKSVPKGFPTDILKKEIKKAMKSLGLIKNHLILLDYGTRVFPEHRQEILDDLIKLNKTIRPDLVFVPSTYDTHQDHQTISQEGFRAFKRCSILGYELPWNNITFSTDCFIMLEEKHILKKIKALSGYQSQSKKFYMSSQFTKSLATSRGASINVRWAEAFQIIRWIL